MILAALNLVNAFRELHLKGLSYQDLNGGNFFINIKTGDVLICDNDNLSPYGEDNPGYMAPEIVRREARPSTYTDYHSGEIRSGALTPLCREVSGTVLEDRGYISPERFEKLYGQGIQLITRLKKNMKHILMDVGDTLLVRKGAVIASVHDMLKTSCQVEHSRHWRGINILVNLFSEIAAYGFLPHTPSLHGSSLCTFTLTVELTSI